MNGATDDFALALRLQEQFDLEAAGSSGMPPDPRVPGDNMGNSHMSLVDERWEVLDPNPEIRSLFLEFNDKYFWGKLSGIEVKWSPRMTLCAGLCVYEGMGGLCSVRLSTPLLKLRPRKDLIETLLHEMIHAYLFVTQNNKDHDGHGPEFHKHMYRINQETGTNISVYHNFHDEVDNYRQHWWKCDGPCQHRPPYFGMVRRAMNRAPAPTDPWWADHKRNCGGTYTKVKEPEGYKKKESKKKEEKKEPEKPSGNKDIRDFVSKGTTSRDAKKPPASTTTKVPSGDNKPPLPNIHPGPSGSIKPTWKPAPIHTISSSDVDSKPTPVQKIESFTGKGKTVGGALGSSSSNSDSSKIVRRIPGIGLITCERPPGLQPPAQDDSKASSSSSATADTNVNKAFSLGNLSKEASTAGTSSLFSNEKHNLPSLSESSDTDRDLTFPASLKTVPNKMPAMPDISDSSDEELFLPHRGPPVKSPNTSTGSGGSYRDSPHFSPDIPPGQSQRIPGFRSVSHRRRRSDPEVWDNKRKRPAATDEPRERRPVLRKPIKAITAADRNKRAVYVSSSENDDDFDEKLTLGSLMKIKADQQSDSDSDFRPYEPRTKVPKLCDDLSREDKTTGAGSSTSRNPEAVDAGGVGAGARMVPDVVDLSGFGESSSTVGADAMSTCSCPVCGTTVPEHLINQHLDTCLLSMS